VVETNSSQYSQLSRMALSLYTRPVVFNLGYAKTS
jgi:hypothetical protein